MTIDEYIRENKSELNPCNTYVIIDNNTFDEVYRADCLETLLWILDQNENIAQGIVHDIFYEGTTTEFWLSHI